MQNLAINGTLIFAMFFLSLTACQSKAMHVAETLNESNYKIHQAHDKAQEEFTTAAVAHDKVVRKAVVPLDQAKIEYEEQRRQASEKIYQANKTLINKQSASVLEVRKVEAEARQDVFDAAK